MNITREEVNGFIDGFSDAKDDKERKIEKANESFLCNEYDKAYIKGYQAGKS
jgi:hypothetical protein